MYNICHQVGLRADSDSVYKALSTAEGISGWWSPSEGDFEAGGEFRVSFGNTVLTFLVLQQNPTKIVWQCVEAHPEWKDTQVLFELEERDGQLFVHFRHEMWSKESDLFAHCSTKWATYMLSLKRLVESGQGHPFPDDISVNHSEK